MMTTAKFLSVLKHGEEEGGMEEEKERETEKEVRGGELRREAERRVGEKKEGRRCHLLIHSPTSRKATAELRAESQNKELNPDFQHGIQFLESSLLSPRVHISR